MSANSVEQARERAEAAGHAIADFFQGNAFSTPVGIKIEQATDGSLASENWGLNMEICDFINMTDEGPRDAVRALRKRLQTQVGRNNQTVLYTLTVLETCVKNCDRRFLTLVLQKDFCQDMVKAIGPKNDPPQVVQERVLNLIQVWADAFRKQDPSLRGVCEVYDELKAKGLEFPPTDLDSMAPILTPKATSPVGSAEAAWVPGSCAAAPDGPVVPSDGQLVKLRSQLDIVHGNMRVLREMLTELAPGQESPDDIQLMVELHTTLHKMQRRVAELLESVANEQVTNELLTINDEMNNLFDKYDRYMLNRKNSVQQRSQPPQDTATSLIDLGQTGDHKALAGQLQQLTVNELSNAATTTAGGRGDPKDQIGEFDMFAQTRNTTFEQSRQSGSTYADNMGADLRNVSLGAVTQQKAEGPGVVPTDKPTDLKEMEQWLQADKTATSAQGTTREFDSFLEHRATAPSSSGSAPANKSAADDALFGL